MIGDDQAADNGEEEEPLNSPPLDERILELVRHVPSENDSRCHTVRPAHLASEIGLSDEDATRELCGLLSAVGGGNDGASFIFEKLYVPGEDLANSPFRMTLTNERYGIDAVLISSKESMLCQ